MFKKDVSNIEIERMMAHHIVQLMKDVKPRVSIKDKEPETTNEPIGETAKSQTISLEEKDFLDSIDDKPDLSTTGRLAYLGLSTTKMNNMKNGLIKRGLITEFSINLGKKHGGIVKLLSLTETAYGYIKKEPKMKKPDNITEEHWFWQTHVYESYISQGIVAEIEKSLNGIRADIGIVWNDKLVALEIELTPKISNITEDLQGGFDKVVIYCKNNAVMKAIKTQFVSYKNYEDIKDRVEIRLLTEIEILKNF